MLTPVFDDGRDDRIDMIAYSSGYVNVFLQELVLISRPATDEYGTLL
jgi:hypothetical protein